jgi:hypothetical protein
MKVIHLSHHNGCVAEIEYVAQQVGFDVSWLRFDGGYNIDAKRADTAWAELKDQLNDADVVLTSDTAPLSRIILQNLDEFRGHLIVWVCNRFDYFDRATLDCDFPDKDYYDLFKTAVNNPRITIIPYTEFERTHARRKNIKISSPVIKPIGLKPDNSFRSIVPEHVEKFATFLIPPYHNDTKYCNLSDICRKRQIMTYAGRYGGPQDVKDFRGIIHIPYAWSNFALFENLQMGVPYMIPSLNFLRTMSGRSAYRRGMRSGADFFWSPPFNINDLHLSEWYDLGHKNVFVYFETFEDLARKAINMNLDSLRERISIFAESHKQQMIERWKNVFCDIGKISLVS